MREIVATARSAATRRRVAELGLADQVVESNAAAVAGADLVIVCVPVGACGAVAAEDRPASDARRDRLRRRLGQRRGACAIWRRICPRACISFPAHPVAGTENSGPDAGFAELFVDRWCILTPPDGADAAAVEKLAAFWRALGANVETMPAAHHDLVLAITSHLPHLIAYTIVGTADELGEVTRSEVLKFSAGGFRDFTRIAASDPTMWRDVFLTNKDAVLEMLGTFNEDLSTADARDPPRRRRALFEHFTRTRAIRRGIVQIGQDSAAPDFGRAASRAAGRAAAAALCGVGRWLNASVPRAHRQRFVDRCAQRRDRERLGDHVVDDGVEAVGALALIGIAGHQQNGEIGKIARRGERQRDAVHDRHADVGEQKIETSASRASTSSASLPSQAVFDLVAVGRERARTQCAHSASSSSAMRMRAMGASAIPGDNVAAGDEADERRRARPAAARQAGCGRIPPRPAAARCATEPRSTNRFPAARHCER